MSHYFINDNNLKSNIKEFKTKFKNQEFIFKTDNGVFSKGEVDFGTRLLLETVLENNLEGRVLDLGCVFGVSGIVLAKLKKVTVDMIYVNKRAIHLTKKNILENGVSLVEAFLSDGFLGISEKYDYIVTNPPIRIGKEKLYQIFTEARNYLKENGVIYLVIRKEQGAKSFILDMGKIYQIEILTKSKGFYIISLKCC